MLGKKEPSAKKCMNIKPDSLVKFGYFEKATKFEKIFHLKFDATQ